MPSEVGVWSSMTMPDGRYTLATEWGGHPTPVWVARFCGEWIYSSPDEFAASLKIIAHARERREALESL